MAKKLIFGYEVIQLKSGLIRKILAFAAQFVNLTVIIADMAIKPLSNENELLNKIASDDQYSFTVLFEHYHPFVFSFGRKLTRSDEVAEEIVQDVFLKIWFGRDKLGNIENFGAYLNTLVRNHAFNLLRRVAINERVSKEITSSFTDRDVQTEQVLDYRETLKMLDQVVETLPLQQKTVYQLCHRDGLKYEEAARQMNIAPTTVHYHMKLALQAIREHFKQNGIAYPALLMFFLK